MNNSYSMKTLSLTVLLAATTPRDPTVASRLWLCIYLLSILLFAANGAKLVVPRSCLKVGKLSADKPAAWNDPLHYFLWSLLLLVMDTKVWVIPRQPQNGQIEIIFDRLGSLLSILQLAVIRAKLIGYHGGLQVGT